MCMARQIRPSSQFPNAYWFVLRARVLLGLCSTLLLSGCAGVQSALQPAGRESRELADLFWLMTVGGAIIWLIVMGLLFYALYVPPQSARRASLLVWGGGIAFPVVVLIPLLIYTLPMMPSLRSESGKLRIEIESHLYWWKVTYRLADGTSVVTANELHLPVGQRAELLLSSADVIHSFWVPSLAGKMDMIPGRINRLPLQPEKIGIYRGACAELCGQGHAFMALDIKVDDEATFGAWLRNQQLSANSVATPEEQRGAALFQESGCSACHAIRGTEANGNLGPDLTHVGTRATLAAGLLPNNVGTMAGWIAASQDLKPGNKMPSLAVLHGDDLRALAAYLTALK